MSRHPLLRASAHRWSHPWDRTWASTVLMLAAALLAGAAVLATAAPASAHVVPSTTITLEVGADAVTADLVLPTTDLATASGIDVPADGAAPGGATAEAVADYLAEHTQVTSEDGRWAVEAGDVATTDVEQWGTGVFAATTATMTWVPPAAEDLSSFTVEYDAVVHEVVTADVYVLLAGVDGGSATSLGAITTDTVTGDVPALDVDLSGAGTGTAHGFTSMVALGVSHIAEGTDHQLFLLTLLLPAPLLAAATTARRRRWDGVVPTRTAARRITAVTLAFTVGHSVTLAAGALGLPVPQQAVEAAIAASILVAAAHATRPLFPGGEALVAGAFGLVHGLAFSTTLTEMDLSGGQLVLALLGFNLGIELMQLAVVLLVLPPLVVLAGTRAYPYVRVGAAVLTALAATGWLLQRLGAETTLGAAADTIGPATPWAVLVLWLAAGAVTHRRRSITGRRLPIPRPAHQPTLAPGLRSSGWPTGTRRSEERWPATSSGDRG